MTLEHLQITNQALDPDDNLGEQNLLWIFVLVVHFHFLEFVLF